MQLSNELKEAIDNNAFCAISTHLNDNEIQTHLMWVDYQDNFIIINTEKDEKNREYKKQLKYFFSSFSSNSNVFKLGDQGRSDRNNF